MAEAILKQAMMLKWIKTDRGKQKKRMKLTMGNRHHPGRAAQRDDFDDQADEQKMAMDDTGHVAGEAEEEVDGIG